MSDFYCDWSNTSLKLPINTLFNTISTEKVVDKAASKFWDCHSTRAINLFKETCRYGMIYIIGYAMDAVLLVHWKVINEQQKQNISKDMPHMKILND